MRKGLARARLRLTCLNKHKDPSDSFGSAREMGVGKEFLFVKARWRLRSDVPKGEAE